MSKKGKYRLVKVGELFTIDDKLSIKCICGRVFHGPTLHVMVDMVFECLYDSITNDELFAVWEQRGSEIITSVNKEVWDIAAVKHCTGSPIR